MVFWFDWKFGRQRKETPEPYNAPNEGRRFKEFLVFFPFPAISQQTSSPPFDEDSEISVGLDRFLCHYVYFVPL